MDAGFLMMLGMNLSWCKNACATDNTPQWCPIMFAPLYSLLNRCVDIRWRRNVHMMEMYPIRELLELDRLVDIEDSDVCSRMCQC